MRGEGRDFRQIFDAGIEALVHVAVEEPPPQPPRELISCHFPLVDGAGNRSTLLSLAIHTVATLVKVRADARAVQRGGQPSSRGDGSGLGPRAPRTG